MSYAKLFSSITESSLWSEPKEVRLLFVTMLAKANSVGFVEASKHGLARAANLAPSEVYRAIRILESPDPDSKNPDCEGRRIVPAPGGWIVLNYEDYRSRQSEEERREYMREYMRNYRSKQSVNNVKESKESPSASASSSESTKRRPKDLAECLKYASTIEVSNMDATAFYDSMEAGGWTRGNKALKDWQAHLRSYKAQGWLASHRNHKNGSPAKVTYKRNYLPPAREPTAEEIESARAIARQETEKLRDKLGR